MGGWEGGWVDGWVWVGVLRFAMTKDLEHLTDDQGPMSRTWERGCLGGSRYYSDERTRFLRY